MLLIYKEKHTTTPSVIVKASKMNDTVLNQLRELMTILGQYLANFRTDFSTLDCNSSQAIMTSIITQLEKMSECAKSIKKICKSLKKESIPCLTCLNPSVDDQPADDQESLSKSK